MVVFDSEVVCGVLPLKWIHSQAISGSEITNPLRFDESERIGSGRAPCFEMATNLGR